MPLRLFLGSILLACQPVALASDRDDTRALEDIVARFGQAIKARDAAAFRALFVPGDVTWRLVYADAALRRIRQRQPQTAKAPAAAAGASPQAMIDGLVRRGAHAAEPVSDLRILSDGDVATLFFRYRYCLDAVESNHGSESWQLLRTDSGWRIASVVWSVKLPSAEEAARPCR